MAKTFRVRGTYRQKGAIGAMEPFSVNVQTDDLEAARDLAWHVCNDAGYEHIHPETVEDISGVDLSSPG